MARCCFYCGRQMSRARGKKRLSGGTATRDHVFPQRLLHRAWRFSPEWLALNQVRCCRKCNEAKGGVHPLTWLAKITGWNPGGDRLAMRLLELGVPADEILAARVERA